MLLENVKLEFIFHCRYRKLSPRTIRNYEKQIDYLLRFLDQEKRVTEIEKVKPQYIKEFLLGMSKSGHTANYVNDLLKASKVFFRYAYAVVWDQPHGEADYAGELQAWIESITK